MTTYVIPGTATVGQAGHTSDHNLITTALNEIVAALPTSGGSGGIAGWKNLISDYSADNTGAVACDTALASAISDATAAQPHSFGLMVPPGTYTVAAHHDLPWNMVMTGAGAAGGDVTGQFTGTIFKVSSSFSGTYVFGFQDTPHVSGFTGTNGAIVSGIYVDGAAQSGSAVDGFEIFGPTMCTFENIVIAQMTGWAINASTQDSSMAEQFPFGQTWTNITADSCGTVSGGGFNLNGCEDSVFIGCYSIGNNNGPGFQINGCDNSKFTACNAEFNSTYGFYITGDWTFFVGGCQFVNISTDRNGQFGMFIDATWTTGQGAGTGPGVINVNGAHFRRDGVNNTALSAGLALGATTLPIIINGFSTFPSVGDGGSGAVTPAFGIHFSASTYSGSLPHGQPILIANGLAWGNTAYIGVNGTGSTSTTFPTGVTTNGILKAHGPGNNPVYGT